MGGSPGELSEELMTQEKRKKGWRMNLSVISPTSQLILQPFHRFTYFTAHSPTLPLLYLRRSSFSNPSFASPTSQDLHLIHLTSRPWKEPLWRASIPDIYRIPSINQFNTGFIHEWFSAISDSQKTTSLHIGRSMFLKWHAVHSQSQSPNPTTPLGI